MLVLRWPTLPSVGLFTHYVEEPLGQQHHLRCAIRMSATYLGGPLEENARQKKNLRISSVGNEIVSRILLMQCETQ